MCRDTQHPNEPPMELERAPHLSDVSGVMVIDLGGVGGVH